MNSPRRLLSTTSMPCPSVASRKAVGEIQRARRGDVCGVDSQPVEHVMFAGVGGGEHLGAEVTGDLDGGLTDTPGAGVDEHPLPGRQPGDLDQGDVGGQKRDRHRGGLGKRPPGRDGHHHALIGDRGGRERVVREQAHHRVTGTQRCHSGPVSMTTPAASPPSLHRRWRPTPRPRHGNSARRPGPERGSAPGPASREGRWAAGPGWPSHPCAVVPSCQAGASGGVRVGVRARRGMWTTPLRSASWGSPAGRGRGDGQQVVVGGGVVGVEQDDAVGVLVLGGVDQRPGRGVRQIGSTVIGADADGVAGDDHQAGVGGVGPGQPALQLGQNVAGQGMHSPQRIRSARLG